MNDTKRQLQDKLPKNLGQYLYKYHPGILEKLFPKKDMKEIREMINWL